MPRWIPPSLQWYWYDIVLGNPDQQGLANHHYAEYGEHYQHDDNYPDQTKHECDLPNERVVTFDDVALAIIDYRPMSSHTGTQHADHRENGSDSGNDHQNRADGVDVKTVLIRGHRNGEAQDCPNREDHNAGY